MAHRFATNKGPLFGLIFLGLPFFGILLTIYMVYRSVVVYDGTAQELALLLISSLILLFLSVFLLRAWYHSYYEVSEQFLYIRFGFTSKKIALARIKSIKTSTYPSAGFRYALAWNGLLIISREGYQWFISPKDQEQFLEKIRL